MRPAITLKQFMIRCEVIKLYREILRTVKLIENDDYKKELRNWARTDFKKYKDLKDEEDIKIRIYQGRMQLKELSQALALVHTSPKK